ncbi:MAG: FkbM family methyltransferase [Terracidiphilus sp.]|nr:FkbM family methyltransferase [Terracidiphilus sp.]
MKPGRIANELRTLLLRRSPESGLIASLKDRLEKRRSYAIYTRIEGAVTAVATEDAVEDETGNGDGMQLWNTPCGNLWAPPSERSTLVFCIGEQERGFYGVGNHGVQPGDIVLDCGANYGTFTRHALNLGAKLVVALEPGPDAARCLARTFAHHPGVLVEPVGVWDEDCTLTLSESPVTSSANSFVLPVDKLTTDELATEDELPLKQTSGQPATPVRTAVPIRTQVPVRTIDSLVESLGLPRIDFIKMDIEGAECKALAGARRTLQTWKPRLALCTYHLPGDPQQIPALVRSIQPDYQMEYGFRRKVRDLIIPRVAHFW